MSYEEELREMCQDLRLPFADQDWGIQAAAAGRVEEFIAYYEGRREATPLQKRLLGDLILASVDAAMEAGALTPSATERCARFIRSVRSEQVDTIAYWAGLESTAGDPFPVAGWLRRVL